MSHSQARNAAPAGSGSAAADVRSSAGGASPLGGCLSPYYISDAAAKAAPAVVNITVQASGALPVGSSGSGFIVDADGGPLPAGCTQECCMLLPVMQPPLLPALWHLILGVEPGKRLWLRAGHIEGGEVILPRGSRPQLHAAPRF